MGSSLANGIIGKNIELFYWSARNREVDFVLSGNKEIVAIEVKSGRNKGSFPGTDALSKEFSWPWGRTKGQAALRSTCPVVLWGHSPKGDLWGRSS